MNNGETIGIGGLLKEIRDNQHVNSQNTALLVQKADGIAKKVEEIEEDLKVISGWHSKIEQIDEHELILFNKKEPEKSIQWMAQKSYNNWQTFEKFKWLLLAGSVGLFFTTAGVLIKQIWS